MTNLSDTLAALSEPVAWMYWPSARTDELPFVQLHRANMDPRYWQETPLYRTGQLVPVPSHTLCIGCEGKPAPENNPCAVCGATAQQLVPVPSVEGVARAIHEAGSDIPWEVTSQQDIAFNRARAVIAAMQEGRDG